MRSSEVTDRKQDSTKTSRSRQHREQASGSINVGELERWGSILGGIALAAYGFKRRSLGGTALALMGGSLLYRGTTGQCQVYQALGINTVKDGGKAQPIEVTKAITIDKPADELYRFWRHFENLPRFMRHLESVHGTGPKRSHWVARGPLGVTVEWDAEVTAEREGEFIAWRSLEGARIPNHGSVRFQPARGGRGTEVHVSIAYAPPMGKLGAAVAKLFGEEPSQQLADDLRRFKCLMEVGEVPTVEGQPSGRVRPRQEETTRYAQRSFRPSGKRDVVEEASEESFPASDAPAWTFRNQEV